MKESRIQSQELWEIPFIKGTGGKNYSLVPSAYTLDCFIRAMDPWPGAWTEIKLQSKEVTKLLRLKIIKAHLVPSTINHQSLIIDLVQLEGKNPVTWEEFKRGYPQILF